jgi:hypothetical protein
MESMQWRRNLQQWMVGQSLMFIHELRHYFRFW